MTAEMAILNERRKLKPGVYGPLPTFFDDNQELDLTSYKKHLLSKSTRVRSRAKTTDMGNLLDLATKGIGRRIDEVNAAFQETDRLQFQSAPVPLVKLCIW